MAPTDQQTLVSPNISSSVDRELDEVIANPAQKAVEGIIARGGTPQEAQEAVVVASGVVSAQGKSQALIQQGFSDNQSRALILQEADSREARGIEILDKINTDQPLERGEIFALLAATVLPVIAGAALGGKKGVLAGLAAGGKGGEFFIDTELSERQSDAKRDERRGTQLVASAESLRGEVRSEDRAVRSDERASQRQEESDARNSANQRAIESLRISARREDTEAANQEFDRRAEFGLGILERSKAIESRARLAERKAAIPVLGQEESTKAGADLDKREAALPLVEAEEGIRDKFATKREGRAAKVQVEREKRAEELSLRERERDVQQQIAKEDRAVDNNLLEEMVKQQNRVVLKDKVQKTRDVGAISEQQSKTISQVSDGILIADRAIDELRELVGQRDNETRLQAIARWLSGADPLSRENKIKNITNKLILGTLGSNVKGAASRFDQILAERSFGIHLMAPIQNILEAAESVRSDSLALARKKQLDFNRQSGASPGQPGFTDPDIYKDIDTFRASQGLSTRKNVGDIADAFRGAKR